MELHAQIEALLFFKGEPISLKRIIETLEKKEEDVLTALEVLEKQLQGRGIVLVQHEKQYSLATSREASAMIEKITKEELIRDLGKAGLETLSIVIYRGPIARREIDHIRGVNSGFILRNLLIRGLVEKATSKEDERVTLYKPTLELLSFLGVSKIQDLPEYQTVQDEIEQFKKAAEGKEDSKNIENGEKSE